MAIKNRIVIKIKKINKYKFRIKYITNIFFNSILYLI